MSPSAVAELESRRRYAHPVNESQSNSFSKHADDSTFICEAVYQPPEDPNREAEFAALASAHGGHLDFREFYGSGAIALTFEFPTYDQAQAAADALRQASLVAATT